MFPVVFLPLLVVLALPWLFPVLVPRITSFAGDLLRKRKLGKRALILAKAEAEEVTFQEERKKNGSSGDGGNDDEWEKVEGYETGTAKNGGSGEGEWEGVIAFFHPFCNAGGGGERVLWAAIRATQLRWPKAVCVVYTGDHEASKEQLVERALSRFDIPIHAPTFTPLYLTKRHYVLSSTYPRFTLLGQSLGSLLLAYDAFSLLVPDIFIDTMGYAFALYLSNLLFPSVPTGAYVHYPTISTDMLGSLAMPTPSATTPSAEIRGQHAGAGTGLRGFLKRQYWTLFARAYSHAGASIDVVMANSSWTLAHLRTLWGPSRTAAHNPRPPSVLFPPVAVTSLTTLPLSPRSPTLLYLAQFRPEKNHPQILRSFALFLSQAPTPLTTPAHLTLIGSVRDAHDATRVYNLRLLAHELGIRDRVTFVTDASWAQVREHLGAVSVGVNAMWNEHFGIGVVEYQAAGLICVVHASGGPKEDIVVRCAGGETGFTAKTEEGFARGFEMALGLEGKEAMAMRMRARENAGRFEEEKFMRGWVERAEILVGLERERNSKRVKAE
ncbi:MAG: asparagine-linked glycosylation protein [Vezdaea aestivalis]|nr:MAG: asparagine-linked glycosylation protein [Vezdaea aestivalis]